MTDNELNNVIDLAGKVAIVTGSGRGIGFAVARALHVAGANIVVNDIDSDRASHAVQQLGDRAIAVSADVSSESDVNAIIAAANERFGGVDILINNAGMDHAVPISDISEAEWDRFMAVNLKSVFLCSKAVLPLMRERGGGRIVNLSSIVARQGAMNGGIHYATTKAGILGFTRTLARQVAADKITVNAVAPGVIDTDLIRENIVPAVREQLISSIPLNRLGDPTDVGRAIRFLVSEEASYITGATLDINGGFWIG